MKSRYTVVINSRRLPVHTAAEAVRIEAEYAEGEPAYIEYTDEQSRKDLMRERTQKVWRDQGAPVMFG